MLPVLPSIFLEGFSISDAHILDPTTGAPHEHGDLFGVKAGEIKLNQDSWDDVSNDVVIDTWAETLSLDVRFSLAYLPLDGLSALTTENLNPLSISSPYLYEMELLESSWGTQRPYSVRVTIPAKDHLGNVRTLYYILYRVKFTTFDFLSTSHKQGMPIDFLGKSLISSVDEIGTTLSEPSFGRLISTSESY